MMTMTHRVPTVRYLLVPERQRNEYVTIRTNRLREYIVRTCVTSYGRQNTQP